MAICQKHGFQTYRYQRQKYTTARLRISKTMMDEVVWPDYMQYAKMLRELLEDIMKDLINKIHQVDEEEILMAGEIDFKD